MNSPRTEPRYGLPEKMIYCKKCVIPNTKPLSMNEYLHTKETKHKYIQFDKEGVCSACRFNEARDDGTIDWEKREAELKALCDRFRSSDGSYDCLVPGSGGKDSVQASHLLKYKYGMHPLTVTWAPHLYTDVGWKNFQNWMHVGGFDNYLFTPNGKIHRLLTRNAFINLLHPFQPFILGQKTFAPKMAARFNIPLIFWGENPGEFGADVSIHEKKFSPTGNEGHSLEFVDPNVNLEELYLGGKQVKEYLREGVTLGDLATYFPLDPRVIADKKIEFHFLGYYIKWIPQEAYYYAVKHTGFQANEERTEGTYSKYNSIDDKTDPYFYYTTYIKFGFGRAIADAAQEIRNHHITREEGVALAHRFDGEFPKRYYQEFLDYLGLTDEEFHKISDSFRDPHIWEKQESEWKLMCPIS